MTECSLPCANPAADHPWLSCSLHATTLKMETIMSSDNTLYLIDGSSYIYRAYFAIRHLSSPEGYPTNAIYGFVQMLLKLLKDHDPKHVAMVFDAGRVTFRTELYPEYKANRVSMPEDLRMQVGPIREVVRAFSIPVLELEGFEADDIIGALACRFANSGGKVVVVTGDKDLMQIVTDRVTLLDTMKSTTSGIPEVIERFGVPPELVVDILGLAGDSSDNIPGVPGIGEKTAIKLIKEYGSLDQLLERSAEVKGKIGEKLREYREQALLSRKLATIDCKMAVDIELEGLVAREPDQETLNAFFRKYGFNSLIKELTARSTLSSQNYFTVTTSQELETLASALEQSGEFAFDLQTSTPDPRNAEITGLSFSLHDHEAFYIPLGHTTDISHHRTLPSLGTETETEEMTLFSSVHFENSTAEEVRGKEKFSLTSAQLPRSTVLDRMRPLLENSAIGKVGHNLKLAIQVLTANGIKLEGIRFDTMLASYVLNPTRQVHTLEALSLEHLGHKMISHADINCNGKDQKKFSQIDIKSACPYACQISDVIRLLKRKLEPLLTDQDLDKLFYSVEMPLVAVLADMEWHGVLLDTRFMCDLSKEFATRLASLEERIFELAGISFNLNSPKQMGEVLFERMGLQAGKKNKGKTGWSTDNEVLTALSEEHEVARLILEYRGISKLKSTYSDALPRLVDPVTGRLHTSYNQSVTNTGRLSSSDPNLQNIPIRSEEGRKIRHAFIAPTDHYILSADYSQIELRVLAHLSRDQVFLKAFAEDEDIHTRTAAEVFGLFPEMVTQEMRRQAKTINFGIIYGQGAFSLAKQLGTSRRTAEEFIAAYKERHKGAIAFLDASIRQAEENGTVTTLMGRRIPIPDINSSNGNVRAFAQRNAINYPIQGSAADIIKSAMLRISGRIREKGLQSRLIMQVHDELVFEVPQHELTTMEILVRDEMAKAADLAVPLKVDISHGANWSEAH